MVPLANVAVVESLDAAPHIILGTGKNSASFYRDGKEEFITGDKLFQVKQQFLEFGHPPAERVFVCHAVVLAV